MKLFSYLWKLLKSYFVKSKTNEEKQPMISKGERDSGDLVIVFDETNRISKSVEEHDNEETILQYF
jgi:hypothetical protein